MDKDKVEARKFDEPEMDDKEAKGSTFEKKTETSPRDQRNK